MPRQRSGRQVRPDVLFELLVNMGDGEADVGEDELGLVLEGGQGGWVCTCIRQFVHGLKGDGCVYTLEWNSRY